MKKVPTGYKVSVTNMINGCLEQGGIADRVIIVPWGSIHGLDKDTDIDAPYNDHMSYRDMIHSAAYGHFDCPLTVIRKGHVIQ